MQVRGEGYSVAYDPATATVTFQGTLRLRGAAEYAPIVQLLDEVVAAAPETITLNLAALRFLNSAGINVLFKFVIKVREQGDSQVLVRASSQVPWQGKSLKNLQRLMPALRLELE